MRLGVVGDIHGNYTGLIEAWEAMAPVDRLLFTGDGMREIERLENENAITVTGVAGNCDFAPIDPELRLLEWGGHRIFLTHGHLYGVKQGLTRLILAGQSRGADLIVFGHTHLPLADLWQSTHVFNPGSLSRERSAGRPSYGIIELDFQEIKTQIYRL